MIYYFYIPVLFFVPISSNNYSHINLPKEHLPYYFTKFPQVLIQCMKNENCPYKKNLNQTKCWGYEHNCSWKNQYSIPACPGDHKGWVSSKFAQQSAFYSQADFGYIKDQLKEMKILCEPLFQHDSSLECTEHLRFCRGRNIMINFTRLKDREDPIRYKMDVLGDGDIGGYCDFHKDKLNEQADHLSPLQSWGPEMRYFTKLNRRPIVEQDCDIVIEKPTFIMKIDATVNMYHHFCDFVNLYMSLHINSTHEDAFSTDIHILIWETFTYRSAFQETWEAFTDNPLWDLKNFRGKTVCFKNVMFPLLPRMIFGLYYNTPIIYGCEKSGLFDAFSKYILHRLKITLHDRKDDRVKVTFLSRNTKYRRILNEEELIRSMRKRKDLIVQRVIYDRDMPFKKQLEISRNSDVFIGMHGAGLTHLLFLPEWAGIFEIYNCQDPNCYFDLARLKGVKYITWEDDKKLTSFVDGTHDGSAHAKFANYEFNVTEFLRLLNRVVKHVKNHVKFKEFVEGSLNQAHHDEL